MSIHDADSFAELRHFLRRENGERMRIPGYESITPSIKMHVGDWYVDELGILTREIKARD
jgi:hypothetical protein